MFSYHRSKLITFIPGVVLPLLSAAAAPSCSDLTFNVSIQTQVAKPSLPALNPNDPNAVTDLINGVLGGVVGSWPLVPLKGTYEISATYCEPKDATSVDKVQLLGHGATYNKLYWMGHGLPDDKSAEYYSWAHFAAEEGYASISIDFPGSGNSTHPDPIFEAQENLSGEVVNEVVKMLKDGKIKNKKFKKVVYVGHSMGSLVGNVASRHPHNSFDALILTGWSTQFVENLPNILPGFLLPASLSDPERFGDLSPFYLALSSKEGTKTVFYGPDGSFDPKVQSHDWEHRDITSVGVLVTIPAGSIASPNFTSPVHILNGEYDAIFCSPGGKCSEGPNGTPGNARDMFPNSRNFTHHIVPDTGHNINLHYSAPEAYKVAHEFLWWNLK